jgi:hypothetical protein
VLQQPSIRPLGKRMPRLLGPRRSMEAEVIVKWAIVI